MGALDEHVADQIAGVEESLTHLDEVLGNLDSIDYNEIVKSLTPLERAKYDLTNLYAINSLFWMYMRSFGDNSHQGAMKEELDRIKQQMMRASQIANKSKMPRINKEVANRMVRHELWEPATSASTVLMSHNNESEGEDWDVREEPMETDSQKSRKRKLEVNPTPETSKSGNSSMNSAASTSGSSSSDEDEGEIQSSSADDTTTEDDS